MKDALWKLARKNIPEGQILPTWAVLIRALLYPLDFFYWRMSQARGYQWQSDTWLIEGVTYSGEALRWLAQAKGETYRVTRKGETVTLERLQNTERSGAERPPGAPSSVASNQERNDE